MIVCICRGVSDKQVMERIDQGASSLRDLQRCGIGDQCGSCHNALKAMLAAAAADRAASAACPACAGQPAEIASAVAV